MLKIVEYKDEYKTAWSEYVENSTGANIAHPIGWMSVIKDGLGHRPRYILAVEDNSVKGILPLAVVKTWWQSRYIISLPWIDYGGICADSPQIERLLKEEACRITENEKAQFMELRSVKAGDLDLDLRQDKYTFLLQLDNDSELIWKGFNAKLRNQIRKSRKSGLTTEFGGVERLPDFYKVFSWKMRDLGTPVWGYKFFESILNIFPETARLILVKKDERVIAGGLVLSFKDRMYVPSAASYRDVLKFCPNNALYWEVIKKGCEEGYKYFDFGRSTLDSNTYQFKKQWVPDPTPLTWQYYLNKADEVPLINPNNPKYRLFINLWRKLPMPVANFLGPKVIKNFP